MLDLAGGERNLIGLARVSTDAQDAQLQRDALTLAGCGRIFEETVSTRRATADRPGLVAARARRSRGESPTEIARALGVSRASVYRHLAAESQKD